MIERSGLRHLDAGRGRFGGVDGAEGRGRAAGASTRIDARCRADYPITAYEANTGQVLRVGKRAGNVHDGKASVSFLDELFEQTRRDA